MYGQFIHIAKISRWRIKAFFDKLKIVDLCRKKRNTAIPPRYRHVLKKGDFNTLPAIHSIIGNSGFCSILNKKADNT